MPITPGENPTKHPVISDTLVTAPSSPSEGDRYITSGQGGAWSGIPIYSIVEWQGFWNITQPIVGDESFVTVISQYKVFNGVAWQAADQGDEFTKTWIIADGEFVAVPEGERRKTPNLKISGSGKLKVRGRVKVRY